MLLALKKMNGNHFQENYGREIIMTMLSEMKKN